QHSLARDLRRRYPERLIIFSALSSSAQQQTLEQMGCLTLADPGRAIRVLAALGYLARQAEQASEVSIPADASNTIVLQSGACNEADALDLLREHGVPAVDVRRARTRDDAIGAASELGFPVVMKVLSPQITHKSDVGGVVLNVPNAEAAGAAFEN